jgi:replicative DNA helicase
MSVAAEQNLIGGILIEPEAFYRVTDLQARHFRDIENRKAFATIQRLLAEGKGVDRELVAEAGGGDPSYLGSLMNNTPGTANIVYYAESIKRDARRLHVELSLKNALSRLAEDSTGVEEVVQATMTALEDYQEHHSKPFSQIVGETLAQAEEAREQRRNGSVIGLTTTLPLLNQLTGGLHGPKLIVLGGRPGTYKTALALQIAARNGACGVPVGFISLEMGDHELAARTIPNTLRLNGADLSQGDRQVLEVAEPARTWDWPLHIEDRLFAWPDIVGRIIGWHHQHQIQCAVIDYLQIVQMPGKASRFEKLSEISREAKLLAKRLGIPILLLAQISRDVEKQNRRPVLSDIRECGNVEQDADIVLFMHCHQQDSRPDEFDLILAKQRNGPAREVIKLQIIGEQYVIGERWEQ